MKKNHKRRVLEERVFKVKSPHLRFFCPLCSSERALANTYKLSWKNFIQIIIITIALTWTSVFVLQGLGRDPIVTYYVVAYFFIVWGAFELGLRTIYRKELPCPYCGFDAAWYKQDVLVTRKLVKEFWDKKNSNLPSRKRESINLAETLAEGEERGDVDESSSENFSPEVVSLDNLNNGPEKTQEAQM